MKKLILFLSLFLVIRGDIKAQYTQSQINTFINNNVTGSINKTLFGSYMNDSYANKGSDSLYFGFRSFSSTYHFQHGVLTFYDDSLWICSNVLGHTGTWSYSDFMNIPLGKTYTGDYGINISGDVIKVDTTNGTGDANIATEYYVLSHLGTSDSGIARGYGIKTTQTEPRVISIDTNSGTGSAKVATEYYVLKNTWSLTGNSGTTPGTNFLGTTDDEALVFKVNSLQSGRIEDSTGLKKNTGIGFRVLRYNIGIGNSMFGYKAGWQNTSGNYNINFGFEAGYSNLIGANNANIGYQAGYLGTGFGCTNIGYNAGYSNTTHSYNTNIGYQAGYSNDDNYTTNIGYQAGYLGTAGYNVNIGYTAGRGITSSSSCISIGYQANYSNGASTNNIAIGSQALFNNTANSNVAIGSTALYTNVSGARNVAIGTGDLYYNTGQYNTAVGVSALNKNAGGNYNSAVGEQAGENNTSGNYNTFLGYLSGNSSLSGSYNIYVGYNAGISNTSLSNQVYIGDSGANRPIAIKLSGALMPYYSSNYQAGTSGQVLESQGAGVSPQWTTITTGGGGLSNVYDSTGYINPHLYASGANLTIKTKASQSLTVSSKVITMDCQVSASASVTLTSGDGGDTLLLTNAVNGGVYTILVSQPAAGSTVAFGWSMNSGTYPTWYTPSGSSSTWGVPVSTVLGYQDKITISIINGNYYVDYQVNYQKGKS